MYEGSYHTLRIKEQVGAQIPLPRNRTAAQRQELEEGIGTSGPGYEVAASIRWHSGLQQLFLMSGEDTLKVPNPSFPRGHTDSTTHRPIPFLRNLTIHSEDSVPSVSAKPAVLQLVGTSVAPSCHHPFPQHSGTWPQGNPQLPASPWGGRERSGPTTLNILTYLGAAGGLRGKRERAGFCLA